MISLFNFYFHEVNEIVLDFLTDFMTKVSLFDFVTASMSKGPHYELKQFYCVLRFPGNKMNNFFLVCLCSSLISPVVWSPTRHFLDAPVFPPARHLLLILGLIHPVQCQQFKRAQFVFLSASIRVILLWVARSRFST